MGCTHHPVVSRDFFGVAIEEIDFDCRAVTRHLFYSAVGIADDTIATRQELLHLGTHAAMLQSDDFTNPNEVMNNSYLV